MTNQIKIVAATPDTVTITRTDFEALLEAVEDVEDLAAVAAHDAEEAQLGDDRARRDYLTADETERLLGGESPVKVWRQKRGLSQRALASAAGMQPGYPGEIETKRKPGSAEAYLRLSAVLDVPMSDLMTREQHMRQRDYGPVLLISTGRLAGTTITDGSPSAVAEFPNNAAVFEATKRMWRSLQYQFPFIADKATRRPIYDQTDLYNEMEVLTARRNHTG